MDKEIKSEILNAIKEKERGMLISEISRQTKYNKITIKKYLLALMYDGLIKTREITKTRKLWCKT